MNITPYTPNYSPSPFAEFPDELFLKTTLDDPQNEIESFKTLYRLSQVCQDLKGKVDKCWMDFILQIGKFPLAAANFPGIDFNNVNSESLKIVRDFLITGLKITSPKVAGYLLQGHDDILLGCRKKYVVKNHEGVPELLGIDDGLKKLVRVDLTNQNYCTLELKQKLNPVNGLKGLGIALSEKHIALCTDQDKDQTIQEISIIEIDSGACCHKILELTSIQQLSFEGKYLYVLGKDSSNLSKFLRYDSTDWNASPKELIFPKPPKCKYEIQSTVDKFFLGKHAMLFSNSFNGGDFNKIYLVEKENCFSDSNPDFFEASDGGNYYQRFKVTDEGFLTVYSGHSGKTSELVLLGLKNSVLTETELQVFPIYDSQILDFHVLFNTLIISILSGDKRIVTVSFFNYINGKHIKDFDLLEPLDIKTLTKICLPQLPNKNIQLLHGTKDQITGMPATAVMNLDFGLPPIQGQQLKAL